MPHARAIAKPLFCRAKPADIRPKHRPGIRRVVTTGSLIASNENGRSALRSAVADAPLRFLFPRQPFGGAEAPAWVCLTTLGGGLVSGDAIDLNVEVRSGATLLMTTQASTKVYRGRSTQKLRAKVDGTLVLLMDPTACFKDARYEQESLVELGPRGSVIWLESVTSGRPAFEEPFSFDAYASRLRITKEGRPIFVDAVSLDRGHGSISARFARERGASFDTLATLVAVGDKSAVVRDALLASAASRSEVLVAASAIERAGTTGAWARIAGATAEAATIEARHRLRNLVEILMQDPFSSRR